MGSLRSHERNYGLILSNGQSIFNLGLGLLSLFFRALTSDRIVLKSLERIHGLVLAKRDAAGRRGVLELGSYVSCLLI